MNGQYWQVIFVDPFSPKLIDRTGNLRVATTDAEDFCIFLSWGLRGDFLARVLIRELGHCAMFSFDMLDTIHQMVYPEYWIDMEEWVCNFIADYGQMIFENAYEVLGNNAIHLVPKAIDGRFA